MVKRVYSWPSGELGANLERQKQSRKINAEPKELESQEEQDTRMNKNAKKFQPKSRRWK